MCNIYFCCESMRPLQSIATNHFQPPIAYAYCLLPITSCCESMGSLQSIATNHFQPPIHLGTDITAEGGQISYAPKKRSHQSWFVQYVMCTKNCHQIWYMHQKLISEYNFCQRWYTKAPKTNIIYAMYKKCFHVWYTPKCFHLELAVSIDPQCNVDKLDLYLCTNQGPRISRIAIEPDNASCHPEYHLWKVRRPKCRPP